MTELRRVASCFVVFVGFVSGCGDSATHGRFIVGPNRREACASHDPLRAPFFGDLHIHSKNSFDAAGNGVRSEPEDAYRFAQGEVIGLPPYDANGNPTRTIQLSHPLDFAAVTDHSEFLAETNICTDPTSTGYGSANCVQYRADMDATSQSYAAWPVQLVFVPPVRPVICVGGVTNGECRDRLASVWRQEIDTAEQFYDRSSACTFTTFIAYEWSGTAAASNWHRNVIFGTSTVPIAPVSFFEAYHPDQLWTQLHDGCLDAGVGCDVLTIPHNGNLSAGYMFNPITESGTPYTADDSRRRRELEPLVEIYQHKGASECTPAPSDPLGSDDPACAFELVVPKVCSGTPSDPPDCRPTCDGPSPGGFLGTCVAPADFARAALRVGLAEQARTGENPFAFGFIGSTDTHNATSGATNESTFQGNFGNADATPAGRLVAISGGALTATYHSSPGGLAVLWAEENSRDALFAAMRRREAYGTSGTRIVLRVFGGFGLSADLCAAPDLVEQGYAQGVPMGGNLPAYPGSGAPTFVVTALRDPDSVALQRVQIVKGWYDGVASHEVVYDVAGDAQNGATVDLSTCAPQGAGLDSACAVFTDPDFDPSEAAFYYVRVLENPTCRWSQWLCNTLAVDCGSIAPSDPYANCCNPDIPKTIQERAWSSPIWYTPTAP